MANHLSIITALDSKTKLELILHLLGMGTSDMSIEAYLAALTELEILKEEVAKVCRGLSAASALFAKNPVSFTFVDPSISNALNPSYLIDLQQRFSLCKNKVTQLSTSTASNLTDRNPMSTCTFKRDAYGVSCTGTNLCWHYQ